MKDTIYRDDAVALVIKAIHGTDNKEIQNYLMDGLRKQMWSLPSAEAVQEWIPCSDRLPSESGWYVISVVGFENITDVSYFYSDESKWSDVSHAQSVVAWMPLPKPYREESEVDK